MTHTKTYTIPAYTISLVRDGHAKMDERPHVNNSELARDIIRAWIGDVDREHFVVLMIDKKNKVIGINTVSVGSLDAAVVHPREIFKAAILMNAAAIICGHNHPSGNPTPSNEDNVLTMRLSEAGKLLGIQVLDHVIIGDGTKDYFSYANNGEI